MKFKYIYIMGVLMVISTIHTYNSGIAGLHAKENRLMVSGPSDDTDAVFAKLRGRFVERSTERTAFMDTEAARVGTGAKESAEALERIRHEAHKLRGTGATFGFEGISEIAGRLEDLLEAGLGGGGPGVDEIRNLINRLQTELSSIG